MLLPSIFNKNEVSPVEDFFDFPFFPTFRDFDNIEKQLYGKHGKHLMKTDIKETETGYELAVDIPGFKKDEVKLSLSNGYLNVSASKAENKEEKDNEGKLIRQERYAGAMSRSFYVGDAITEEEVKAKFEDGVLQIEIPKKEIKEAEEKKLIEIK